MTTTLKSCRVPWDVSASPGVTLVHQEGEVAPECKVAFCGSRLGAGDLLDMVQVQITFHAAWHARVAPKFDQSDIESEGFEVPDAYIGGTAGDYLEWRQTAWREQGVCPDASFYVATRSDWLETMPKETTSRSRHYVVCGRDGYAEILAEGFSWRELGMSGEDGLYREGEGVE